MDKPHHPFTNNFRTTICLLLGLLTGAFLGMLLGERAGFLRPVGELFLNLVFVLVVPLVFFSVAQSMIALHRNGVVGKVLGAALGVFLFMSVVAGVFSFGLMSLWNPFSHLSGGAVAAAPGGLRAEGVPLGEALVGALTVDDFPQLFSREHLLPLILVAALAGLAVALLGDRAVTVRAFIEEGGAVVMKMMELVMKAAPIGIGCYFADITGRLGGHVVGDYPDIFLAVCAACGVCYLLFHSLYALFCRIPLGKFWKEMLTPSATAIGTCSSAACIPASLEAARNLGVSERIADGVIPLGTNLHKDGSVVTSVAKVLFALCFHGILPGGAGMALTVIGLAVLESLVVGAIPVGGMTGEILICTLLGLDPSFAATLLIIGTICDIPATLLNTSGNLVAALLVQRLTNHRSS